MRNALWCACAALLVWGCDDGDGPTGDVIELPAGGEGGAAEGGAGGEGEGGAGGEGGGVECEEGLALCGDTCVDRVTDPNHCGRCDSPCEAGEVCEQATCVAPDACARPPLENCDASDDAQPPPMNEHVAGYDDERQMMIIFGGNTATPENCGFPAYTFMARTWIFYDFDTGCGHWVEVEGNQPPGRSRHAGAFGGGYFWVHGGRFRAGPSGRYEVKDDLWRFDPQTRTWEEVVPMGAVPAGRFNHTLVWDSTHNELLLYAGNTSGSGVAPAPQADVWAYNVENNAWREIAIGGNNLSARMWQEAFWDAQRERMIVFGGGDASAFNDNARYFNEVYAFDPVEGRWSQMHNGRNGDAPDGRFWSRMVHDTQNDLYVMFAGHDDQALGNANDTWTFDPNTREWTAAAGADAFNRPANGFCDFPADFTTVAPGTPERRNAHTMVYSQTCGHAITFGGKTDCGAVNDVWRFGADGWSNPVMASEGEACLRWRSNPDNCANMCF
jgi:N-acetylneuraminic acid mutarotase